MAQLSIRDKDYLPNQYLNPMLISGGREANPDDRPYRVFDRNDPEHPDYEGNKDDGPEYEQLSLPLVKGKKNQDMTIAGRPGYHVTTNGGMVNQAGKVFYNDNGVLRPDGDYDEKIHGALIPPIGLDQANKSMQINQDVAQFPRLSTGEPMTNIEKKQGLDVLRKTKNPKQIKLFIQQYMKGV